MEKKIIFSLSSSKELTNEICRYLDVEPGKVDVKHFADGEVFIEPKETVRGRNVYIIQSTCNPVNENLMELLVCIDACKRASAGPITAVIPYFGYARQDRKASARQPITAKLVADLLQAAGASRVVTVDLHASQIQGFFNIPIDDLSISSLLGNYLSKIGLKSEEIVVVSPDHGGTTRARRVADYLNCSIAIIDKRRQSPNQCEAMNVIGEVNGKTAIVIDDICDTAGSLVAGCEILKKHGAQNIYVGITHGVLSNDAVIKIKNSSINKMFITNTIETSEEKINACGKIEIISIAKMLSRIITAINEHTPVSPIYELYADGLSNKN